MTEPPARTGRLSPATRMGLSIAAATGLYGVSFGALAVAAGLTVAVGQEIYTAARPKVRLVTPLEALSPKQGVT